jgi:hypothetical protein
MKTLYRRPMKTTPRLYRGAAGSSRLPAKSVTPPKTLLPAATAHACCGGVSGAAAHAPPPVHLPTLYQVAVKTLMGAPCYGSVHALLRHPIRGHEEAFSQLVADREVRCFREVDFFFPVLYSDATCERSDAPQDRACGCHLPRLLRQHQRRRSPRAASCTHSSSSSSSFSSLLQRCRKSLTFLCCLHVPPASSASACTCKL